MSAAIRNRAMKASSEVQRIAWGAQNRLCNRFRRLTGTGKQTNKAMVAIARELAGFVWAIARQPNLVAPAA